MRMPRKVVMAVKMQMEPAAHDIEQHPTADYYQYDTDQYLGDVTKLWRNAKAQQKYGSTDQQQCQSMTKGPTQTKSQAGCAAWPRAREYGYRHNMIGIEGMQQSKPKGKHQDKEQTGFTDHVIRILVYGLAIIRCVDTVETFQPSCLAPTA